jgi:hypothetical protein
MRAAVAALALLIVPAQVTAGAVKPPTFEEEIQAHRLALSVAKGALAGPGAGVLKKAIDDATFVLLGEDHGIEQIPTLASAVCAELAPHGFRRVALEVGPSVAEPLAEMAAAKDGAAQMKRFDAKYPETVAFYSWREDFGFVSSCAKAVAAHKGTLEVWGVDQELMGATQLVFDQMFDSHPPPGEEPMEYIDALRSDIETDREEAVTAGDFGKLFLMAAPQATLDRLHKLLDGDSSEEVMAMYDGLLTSRAIYQGEMSGAQYDSNVTRAQLMKDAFFGQLSAAAAKDKAMPKVLVKLGAWHLYRGMNPLHSSELGNLIAEAAAAHDVKAVNVLVLGVTGKQLAISAPGAQAPVALDLRKTGGPYAFLAPFFTQQIAKSWTLFDLRPLRAEFDTFGKLDPEMERMIFGYDFLVLVADPRPEHPL